MTRREAPPGSGDDPARTDPPRRCPACGRPFAQGARRCPYCDEPLPRPPRRRGSLRLCPPRRFAPALAPAAVVAALLAADPALRNDAALLARAHGPGLAAALAAACALCRTAPPDAVCAATPRERLTERLRLAAPGLLLAAALALAALLR